jgi:ubiquinone biosynthesis protein
MVVIEGVARELADDINIWELAKPLVSKWMMQHMGPKAQLEFMASDMKDQLHDWMVLPSRMESVFEHIENTSQTMRDQKPSYILLMMGALFSAAGGAALTAYAMGMAEAAQWGGLVGAGFLLAGIVMIVRAR